METKEHYGIQDLLEIMRILRAPGGCPWDAEQTHASIRNEMLEEAYEAVEGIDRNDVAIMCEELGDVLLQVVFHARIAEENGTFNFDDVCDGICKKLIFRHPHVFGEKHAENSAEVLKLWDEAKRTEKKQKTEYEVLSSVSRALPALTRASKLQKKAKIKRSKDEAIACLRETLDAMERSEVSSEAMGTLLMDVTALARAYDVPAEEALDKACSRLVEQASKTEFYPE